MINGDRLLRPCRRRAAGPGHRAGGGRSPPGRWSGWTSAAPSWRFPGSHCPSWAAAWHPDLFEASALRRAETGGRLPVTVTYQGKVPALPGVTITLARGGTAQGYLTAAGAATFGAALARQFAADHATGSYGRDGMFADGRVGQPGRVAGRCRAAGATALPGVPHAHPHGHRHQPGRQARHRGRGVRLRRRQRPALRRPGRVGELLRPRHREVQRAGRATSGPLAIFQGPVHGKAVPAAYSVIVPQITASRNVTVHMAARSADSKIQMVTPRPAVPNRST